MRSIDGTRPQPHGWPARHYALYATDLDDLAEAFPDVPDDVWRTLITTIGPDRAKQCADGSSYRSGFAFPGRAYVARCRRRTARTIQRHWQILSALGLLTRCTGPGRGHVVGWRVNWDLLKPGGPGYCGAAPELPPVPQKEILRAQNSSQKEILDAPPYRDQKQRDLKQRGAGAPTSSTSSQRVSNGSNDAAPPPADVHRRLYGTDLVLPTQQTTTPPPSALEAQHAAAVARFDQMATTPLDEPATEPVAQQTTTPPPTALDAQHTQAAAEFDQMAPQPPDEPVAQPAAPQPPTPLVVDPDDEAAVTAEFEALMAAPLPPRRSVAAKRWEASTPNGRKAHGHNQALAKHDSDFWPRAQALGLLDAASSGGQGKEHGYGEATHSR